MCIMKSRLFFYRHFELVVGGALVKHNSVPQWSVGLDTFKIDIRNWFKKNASSAATSAAQIPLVQATATVAVDHGKSYFY